MANNNEIERDAYVKSSEFNKSSCHIQEENRVEYKTEYIEFINKLMNRMKMKSIERMLDAALNEIGMTGGL